MILVWICRGCGTGITDRNITTVNEAGAIVGCTECTDLPPLDIITLNLGDDMSYPVPAEKIEQIVGARRHPSIHLARAKSDERWVYVLHSETCLEEFGEDLTQCPYSCALDDGIELSAWAEEQDHPVAISIGSDGRLVPQPGADIELLA